MIIITVDITDNFMTIVIDITVVMIIILIVIIIIYCQKDIAEKLAG